MVQRGKEVCFTLEAGQAFGIVSEQLRQDLDGHLTAQLGIPRPVNLSHPPLAEG